LLCASVYAWGMNFWGFGEAALMFLKGGIIWVAILVSLVFLVLGISDIKE